MAQKYQLECEKPLSETVKPNSLYAKLHGVKDPVQVITSSYDFNLFECHEYAQNPANKVRVIDDIGSIEKIADALDYGPSDDFSSILNYRFNRKLVQRGKISRERFRDALDEFCRIIFSPRLMGELIDTQPEKRGVQMPESSRHFWQPEQRYVALYRGYRVVDGRLDLSGVSPAILPYEGNGHLSEKWRTTLGSRNSVYQFGELNWEHAEKVSDGLVALSWDLNSRGGSNVFDFCYTPNESHLSTVLFGSTRDKREIVKDPRKIEVQIPELNVMERAVRNAERKFGPDFPFLPRSDGTFIGASDFGKALKRRVS